MSVDIKVRLLKLHMTQVQLVDEIRRRGVRTSPEELSKAINGHKQDRKAQLLLEMCETILTEAESMQKGA